MARSAASQLPALQDRPTDSDGLPSGDWAREIEQGGYEPQLSRGPSAVAPMVLLALVLAATVLLCALWWDRIPDQVAAHTGADGQVTRWEPKSLGTVLVGPLLGAGGVLFAAFMVLLVAAVRRPHPGDPFADGLGPMIRQAATNRRFAAATTWSMLPLGASICLTTVLGWADGSGELRAPWLIGAAMLALPVIAAACLRGVRDDVERELELLEIPLGPGSEQDLRRWRIPGMVDDPELPLMVQNQPSNWTLNWARPAGRAICWALAAVWVLVSLPVLVGPLLL